VSTPDVQALLAKAEANISAARLLLEADHLDSAASRAYYAMFYVAEALLAHIGQSYNRHAAVIAAFGREYAKTGVLDPEFHRWLIDAQDLRSIADYTANAAITQEKVRAVCGWADRFLQAARDHVAGMEG
jgi:uncharacterized protein (UPF0332 family)